jgi:uncharacterized alpha-E superfamily protein
LSSLLARYAEAIFWMARYMERAEDLARILDVNETFSRDSTGLPNWNHVLHLYAEEKAFKKKHGEITPEGVIRYYVLDPENPGSIRSCIRAARDNARSLRPLISTEMWTQLNTLYRQFGNLTEANISEHRLGGLCNWIKLGCQTYHGVTEGTFFRDAGWHFYLIGKNLERADQMTRLIDVKYHLLLPQMVGVGSAIDVSQWMAVLRSAAGYHAFRRIHPRGMSAMQVSGFLLLNTQFPRSTRSSVEAVALALERLSKMGVVASEDSIQSLAELRADFNRQTIKEIVGSGLHEYLDGVQLRLIDLAEELGRTFFGYDYPQPGQTQIQETVSQS